MERDTSHHSTSDSGEIARARWARPLALLLIGAAFGAILLLLGGSWGWVEAWLFSGCITAYLLATAIWVAVRQPGLGAERVRAVLRPGSLHEKVILVWVLLAFVLLAVVAGLDGGRFRWSRPSAWIEVAGFALLGGYFALNVWVMVSNPFLSAVARVQQDRGQFVVSTGPYRLVRHPMYVGVCLLAVAAPLALGALWALVPGALLVLTFVYRTWQEDRLLRAGLEGYAEYAGRVRYRLVPGVW